MAQASKVLLRMIVSCCLFLFLLIMVSAANGVGATTQTFNVVDFGAVSDEKTDNAQAFLAAWRAACATRGCPRVFIPEGTYLVGPVDFAGPCNGSMVLQVSGRVIAPTDLTVFPASSWISFSRIDGLVIAGTGKFDGRGASAWPHNQCPKHYSCKLLPTSLTFNFITNGVIRGISSIDSKMFHMNIFGSKDIKIQSLTIRAPGDSPNTDGIHIGRSTNVEISKSIIATGDDCISFGDGSTNITVSEVQCGPGHGISIGSLGRYEHEEDVVGVSVKNCTIAGTTNGVRIKTWKDSVDMAARDLVFENIVMRDVYNPIIIDQEYCPYVSCSQRSPSRVKISNVKFRNIRGVSTSKVAVNLLCSKDVPCKGVELDDINLQYSGEGDAAMACSNVVGTALSNVIPPPCV